MSAILRNFHRVLAFVLQAEPQHQLYGLLYLFLFPVVVNLAINALYAFWQPTWWVISLLTVALLVGPALILSVVERRHRQDGHIISYGPLPDQKIGLILPLSLFYAPADNRPAHGRTLAESSEWKQTEIINAVADPTTDWAYLRQRFEQSNMGPALAAIRYHANQGVLQHLWLITTLDEKNEFGKVIQPGSVNFAPVFTRILNDVQGYAMALTVHYDDPVLQVGSTDLMAAYHATTHVFTVEAGRWGLTPTQIMVDITNGRLPTSIGMALACATQSWPMQYTTTVEDPLATAFRKMAQPREIAIDPQLLLQYAIRALERQRPMATTK